MNDDHATFTAPYAFAEHEHRELLPRLARLHEAALALLGAPADVTLARIDPWLRWIDKDLLPHMAWEEAECYPLCDRVAGTAWATRTMRHEHGQVRALVSALHELRARFVDARPTPRDRAECAARLFGLESVLRAHLEREEDQLLPLLGAALVPA